MVYMSVNEAAHKWNISVRRVQQMCKSGEIPGAVKKGRSWVVPENVLQPVRKPSKTSRSLLPLPVGISSYVEAVSNYYYVDKTLLIRDFVDTLPKVSLFTRPRRFGKTLNMDMLRVFFEKTEEDTSCWFKDKKIWSCGETYRKHQGCYPVIFLTFKDVKYASWENALSDISEIIRMEYSRHAKLRGSGKCTDYEKSFYTKIISGAAEEVELARSLSVLSSMLHKHAGMPAVIIIDEYDTPIQQGHEAGYYKEVIGFIRNLFSGAFKDNPHLAYGFLTGILRVAKESIFSGMNNLKVNTIMDDRFSAYFGFTENEVEEMLAYYGCPEKMPEAKSWYDGYRFGNSDVFNPWSIINYADEHFFPKTFWQSTGNNAIIGDILKTATPETMESLKKLLQGGQVTTYVDTGVIYPEILHNPSSIYSFLLMTGYLKNDGISPQSDGNYICNVSIPNREISYVYEKEILTRWGIPETESTAARIQQAFYEQDEAKLAKCIEEYLRQTVSFFDTTDEIFYQGLVLGFIAILNNRYFVRSNRESGEGRFDIQLIPKNNSLPGILMELKVSKDENADLRKLAEDALLQIEQNRYETEMLSQGIKNIFQYGVAFRKKDVEILLKKP
jgi:hypothetical protein